MNKDNPNVNSSGHTSPPSEPTSSLRILVVDDEMVVRELCAKVLVRSGYQVETADGGTAAWNHLQQNNFDLLLTDYNLGGMTGLDLIKKLRSADLTLPVIMMSGIMPTEELNRNPELHMAAQLLKPFAPADLLATVKRVLSAKDQGDELLEPSQNRRSEPSEMWLR